jgi:hypothetical protein
MKLKFTWRSVSRLEQPGHSIQLQMIRQVQLSVNGHPIRVLLIARLSFFKVVLGDLLMLMCKTLVQQMQI